MAPFVRMQHLVCSGIPSYFIYLSVCHNLEQDLKTGAFQHPPHSKPVKQLSSLSWASRKGNENVRNVFFCNDDSDIGPLPAELWHPPPPPPPSAAGCSTGQSVCIINDIQIPRLKGLLCGLDERISVLPLPSLGVLSDIIYFLRCSRHLWHLSLPVELRNNVNEFISFLTRLSGLCFWPGWCLTQNNSLLSNADQTIMVFVDRRTPLFGLCAVRMVKLWNRSVHEIQCSYLIMRRTRTRAAHDRTLESSHTPEFNCR